MIKSLLARVSATLVFILIAGLVSVNSIAAQNTIEGVVCGDTDEDGIAEFPGDDDALAGVTVELFQCTGDVLYGTTTTDTDGEYAFTDIPDGCYYVVFAMPTGYCALGDTDPPTKAVGMDGVSVDVEMVFGTNTVHDFDVCFTKSAKIQGVAWLDSNGDGIFSEESTLGNIIVTLSMSGADPLTSSTDKNGAYSFDGLCPGDGYVLSFATPAGHFVTVPGAGTDATIDSDINSSGNLLAITLIAEECKDVNAGYVKCDDTVLSGELTFCNDNTAFTETYVVADLGPGTYTYTPANMVVSSGGNVVAVNIPATGSGSYTIGYSYALPGGLASGCSGSFEINVVDPPASNVLACNNTVNFSLSADCTLEISPDMLLEGSIADDAGYLVELQDIEGDSILPSNMAGYEYAGKTLVGKVTNVCTGNSCWGNINVEDKNIPELDCKESTVVGGVTITTGIEVKCGDDIAPVLSGVTTFNFNEVGTTDDDEVFNDLVNWPISGSGCATVLANNCFTIETIGVCGPSTLCYEDTTGEVDCGSAKYSQITTRKWTITTPSGTSNTCTEEIGYLAPVLDELDFPGHVTGDDALDCRFGVTSVDSILDERYWLILPNGNPDPASPHHDLSIGGLENSCERLKTTYADQRFGDCDGSYKLQRTWIVLDWCTSAVKDSVQIIEVEQRGNIVLNIPNQFQVDAKEGCTSAFDAPAPNIIFPGCSPIKSISVGYKLVQENVGSVIETFTFDGVTENADGTFRIPRVDGAGTRIWIGYVVMNECGQMTEGFTEADFVDVEEPVAVCDQETVVSLNSDGVAYATPEAFDDGSWDNCGISHLEVMKVTGSDCGELREFDTKIKFCCEDVGAKVEILVKVIDNVGLENTCKSWVEIQDNFAPVLISCPEDVNVNCDIDPMNLSSYGAPEFDGVCDINIKSDTIININDCGIGTIRRIWEGVNSKGTEKTCEQTINVGRLNPFDEFDVVWPKDFESDGCFGDANLDPRNLPDSLGLPIISDVNCSKISFDYEDLVLQSDEACVKIIRQWTVLDWCQYTASYTTGSFVHNQIIKIHDTTEPVIESGCSTMLITDPQDDNCQVNIEVKATGSDDCTAASDLIWSYSIRESSDTRERTGNGNDLSGLYSIGNYRITWTVRDNCNNETSCSQTLTVQDAKAPTPYCLGDLVTVLNQGSGEASVWASDFVTGSTDNCGPKENNVSISFSEDPSDTNITVTCADFTSEEYDQKVKVYAIDAAGNFTYCEARLIVQDNHDICDVPEQGGDTDDSDDVDDGSDDADDDSDDTDDGSEDDDNGSDETMDDDTDGGEADSTSADGSAIIAGHVFTIDNKMVEGVEVNAYGDAAGYHDSYNTDLDGTFAFPQLQMYTDYMIEASKSDSYSNGVSTLDLVHIQRHILGLKILDSPFKVIAADANGSQTVSASDLVLLRKLILGITDELPNSDAWRFIEQDQEFANLNHPFPFREQIEYYDLQANEMSADFVAVKIGDVNNTATINNLAQAEVRSGSKTLIAKAPMREGGIVMLPIHSDDIETIAGLQFTLDLGREFTYKGISAKQLDVSEGNVGKQSESELTLSWNASKADVSINSDTPLFYLILESSNSDSNSEQIEMNSTITAAEVYTSDSEIYNLSLTHEFVADKATVKQEFKLYQNVPNPFSSETTIGFYLPQSEVVTVRVIDLTGKVVMSRTATYTKGKNEIIINSKEINTQGVLYYQLETTSNIANMKMIVLK